MGWSGSLALTLAVAASLLQLLLLLPPPVSSLPARPPPKISSYAARARPLIEKFVADFLKDRARQGILDLSQSQHKKDDDQLGTGAADTAGLIVFNLSIGTPPAQSFTGIMDITSQLVWAQCGPCTNTSCLTFQPSKSATFSTVPCSSQTCQSVLNQTCDGSTAADNCTYTAIYGDGAANTSGYLATDTITFGGTPLPGMVFGCSGESAGDFNGASGVIALGRGPLSLVSQLHLSRFSYFLAPDDSDDLETVIQLGGGDDDSVPKTTKRSRSTPLLASSMYPDLYYVKLTGIQVDGEDLNGIPAGTFDLRADGSGGVFLSTTIPITYLEQAAYGVVRQAFVSRIQSPAVNGSALGLDLCYTMQSMEKVTVPRLTLVFDGSKDAAAMELKTANYFFKDNTTELECLTILPSLGGSLLGSLLQTGKNMIYDLDGAKLTFETAGAAAPPPAQVSSLMIIAPCFLVLWVLLS